MEQQAVLVRGSIFKTMLKFCIPLLVSNLMQALYSTVDLLVVGWFADAADMSGIATGGQLIGLITAIYMGFATAGTVMVGHHAGAGENDRLQDSITTILSFMLATGLAVTALVLPLSRLICQLMKTPGDALSETLSYLRICACGFVPIALYNGLCAILRGLGDSVRPLLFAFISCAVNIVGDLVLVAGLDMGAAGAALATVSAQVVCVLFAFMYLKRKYGSFSFRPELRRWKGGIIQKLCKSGVPLALDSSLATISFLFILSTVNELGVAASAALGANDKIGFLTFLPASAFSGAVTSVSAQCIGAGDLARAQKTMKLGVLLSAIFGVIVVALMQLFPETILGFYTPDPEVIAQGAAYMRSSSWDCLLVMFFCINGFLYANGRTTFPFVCTILSSFGLRIPLAMFFGRQFGTMYAIGFAAPISSLFVLLVTTGYYLSGKWKQKR